MDETNEKRFPHPGKLCIAILESLVKPVIGEDAIKEIKAPVKEQELRQSLKKVLSRTEKRFTDEYQNHELTSAILDLPLVSLPSVQKAIRDFYEHPSDPALEMLLVARLKEDYPFLADDQVTAAVRGFLKISASRTGRGVTRNSGEIVYTGCAWYSRKYRTLSWERRSFPKEIIH